MELTLEIERIEVRIATEREKKPAGSRKVRWYAATWECLACGARGCVGFHEKQNTDMGASAAAQGRARRHIEEQHKTGAQPT